MDLTHAVAIVNGGVGETERADVQAALHAAGVRDVRVTAGAGEASRLAATVAAEGRRLLLACGGDGTLGEIVNGLAPDFTGFTVGIVPLGTGNDFARTTGIPEQPALALDALRSGREMPVDVMLIRSGDHRRYAINASTGGFSTAVDARLTDDLKDRFGALAYLVAAGRSLADLDRYTLRLVLDDDERIEVIAYNFVIANGRTLGGGRVVAPDADPFDGLLDVVVVPALPLPELATAVATIVGGTAPGDGALLRRRTRRARIDATPVIRCTADGELAFATPLDYEVVPAALTVLAAQGG